MTHSGLFCTCIPCNDQDLAEIYEQVKDFEIICIDEGCFFKSIVTFCEFLATKGHHVIVASLIGTYRREGFGDILNLIPKCENVTWLTAGCMECLEEGAAFTKRIKSDNGEFKVKVGGKETYLAVCRKCFYNKPKLCNE
jgi:thymidine kinase